MNNKIERRLTTNERKIIAEIEKRASKRKHITQYNPDFIVNYFLEGFKDFSYDEKEDAIDMLNAIFEVALKCKVMTEKQIIKEREDMMKEYVDNQFEEEDDNDDEDD